MTQPAEPSGKDDYPTFPHRKRPVGAEPVGTEKKAIPVKVWLHIVYQRGPYLKNNRNHSCG